MDKRYRGEQEITPSGGVVRINGQHYYEVLRMAESAGCTIKAVIDRAVEEFVAKKRRKAP